jgi:DNA-binding transcriptional MerR regulator
MSRHRVYAFGDVVALTGATRSQLIHWTATKLITAGVRDVQGTGHHRVFRLRDLVDVAVAVALARHGVSVKRIGVVLHGLARQWRPATRAADTVLLVTGDPQRPAAFWFGSRREFAAELRTPTLLTAFTGVLLDLGQIVAALEQDTGDRLTTRKASGRPA